MRGVFLFCLAIFLSPFAESQSGPTLGFDPFGTFQSSSVDNVNLTNGNVVFRIPLFSLPQRGAFKPITFFLGGDTAGWTITQDCVDSYRCYYRVQPTNPGGFGVQLLSDMPKPTAGGAAIPYSSGYTYGSFFASFSVGDDGLGTSHPLVFQYNNPTLLRSVDGSGYLVTYPSGYTPYDLYYYNQKHYGSQGPYPAPPLPQITDRSGIHTVQIPVPDTTYDNSVYSGINWYSGVADLDGNTITYPHPFPDESDQPSTDTIGRQIYATGFSNSELNTSNPTGNCPNLGASGQPAVAWVVRNLVNAYGQANPDPRYSYKICYTNINYHTNSFGGSNGYQSFSYDPQEPDGFFAWEEAIGQATVIQSIVMPDGSYWGFVYDSVADPVASPNAIAMGMITKIITPEGGAISYCYNLDNRYPLGNGLQGTPLSVVFPVITKRQEQTVAGSNTDACAFSSGYYSYNINPIVNVGGTAGSATVIDPAGNQTNRSFGLLGDTAVDVYEGNGSGATLLKHTEKQYTSEKLPQPDGYSIYQKPTGLLHVETTSLNGTVVGSQTFEYDQTFTGAAWSCDMYPFPPYGGCAQTSSVQLRIGMLQSVTTRDGAGNLLNATGNSYVANPANSSDPYLNANLIDLKSQVTTSDSTSSTYTNYSYDEPAFSSGGIKGHLTTTSVAGVYPAYTYWRASLGLPDHVVDAKNTTIATYGYDQTSYASPGITYPSASGPVTIDNFTYQAALQPTSITSPTGTDSYTYDITSGLVKTHTDVNNQTTTLQYDGMKRVWAIQYPDAAAISPSSQSEIACYTSPTSVTVYQAQGVALSLPSSSSTCPSSLDAVVTTENVDGLGRKIASVLSSAPGGAIETDTTYDVMGRVYSVSNPYIGTPTGYASTTTYDALSRPRIATDQMGKSRQSSYFGLTTTLTDEVQNIKKTISDFAGRVTDIYEPTAPNTDPTLHTNYSYNVFGLTDVNQYGSMTRHFDYGPVLPRLIGATNPETGTVTYDYSVGASICSSDPSLPCSKTDARGSTVNYTYDSLNRLTSKTNTGSPGGLTTCYQYGVVGSGVPNGIGRLTAEWTQTGTSCTSPSGQKTLRSILAYDSMGRVKQERQCAMGICSISTPPTVAYSYDLAGKMKAYTNGLTGATGSLSFAQEYDNAGRLLSVTSSMSDSTHPGLLWLAQSYGATGLTNATLGNHVNLTRTYDPRLRVNAQTVLAH